MANIYASYPVSGGAGVTSLDGLTGALTLVAGTGITIVDGVSSITISSTSTGDVTLAPVGSSPNANAATLTGQALNLEPASISFPGVVTTSAQTFAGTKTFANIIDSGLTASTVPYADASKQLVSSAVTPTELGYVSGVTSAIQTQLNSKQAALTLGDLSDVGTDGIVITGGTGAIIGSGVTIAQHVADSTHNGYLSQTDWSTFNNKQASGNYLTALTGDVTASGPGSVAATVALVGGSTAAAVNTATVLVNTAQSGNKFLASPANGTSAAPAFRAIIAADIPTLNQNTTGTASNITAASNSTLTTLSSLSLPYSQITGGPSAITALTGDATASGPGSVALTLATVNSNVGSFGSSTSIPSFTVNAKGLITAASGNVVIAPAGTLSGTTLNSSVVTSSLTSVGTIATGVWNGTTIAIANGGTGQTTKAPAFDALSPMSASGDIIYGGASGTGTRLAKGSDTQVLTLASGLPTWSTPAASAANVVTKTAAYSAVINDYILVSNSGASYAITLPTAVGVGGKAITLLRTDSALSSPITIATTSSQTIGIYASGVPTLSTQGESYVLTSDGANWQITSHSCMTPWVSYTPTFVGFGTVSTVDAYWRREGPDLRVRISFLPGTTTATTATVSFPTGLTSVSTISTIATEAGGYNYINVTSNGTSSVLNTPSSSVFKFARDTSSLAALAAENGNTLVAAGNTMSFNASVPISNWVV